LENVFAFCKDSTFQKINHNRGAAMKKYLLATFLIIAGLNMSGSAQTLRGTILSRRFIGQVTHDTVRYNIYLPQGYATNTARYPVIYNLHGLSGSRFSHNEAVAQHFETAQDAGLIGPVIIVFPDGYENSWWADSFKGDKPAETNVVRELIPAVDSLYRTIPDRQFRVIYGFSMGGFGASKFISKFPNLFKTCVIHDGAVDTWETFMNAHPHFAREIFNNDEDYFNKYAPWLYIARRDSLLRANVSIRIVVGELRGVNRDFRDTLLVHAIPFEYVETTCGHDLPCVLDKECLNTAAFVAKSMSTPTKVEASVATLPNGYALQQNYPNPFWSGATSRSVADAAPRGAGNPSTVISFQLPVSSRVTLKVFDMNGREVATLVDGEMTAGKHAVTFAPRDLAGGLYFYKLTAGQFSQTRKAVLMK
jgi:endo-1,4-beta-xylanase